MKTWEAAYSRRLRAKISAAEPIRYPQRNVAATCEGFAQLLSAIQDGRLTYDGDPRMTAHLLNARKSPLDAVGKGAARPTKHRAPRRLY